MGRFASRFLTPDETRLRERASFAIVLVAVAATSVSAVTRCFAETVTLFGKAGTFGDAGTATPSGHSLRTVAVAEWEIDPGLTFFFPAVTSDGTVFIGNMVQTNNAYLRSSCSTVVTCFNPDEQLCFDAAAGSAKNFANLRIPNAAGELWDPVAGAACAELEPFEALGGDVSDVLVTSDTDLGERVVFNSAIGSLTTQGFPALGAFVRTARGWELDAASLRQPVDLFSPDQVACEASPAGTALCLEDAQCETGLCDLTVSVFGFGVCVVPCASAAACGAGQVCDSGRCANPSCAAMNETAVLPRSGRVAVAHYSGRLSVLDGSGSILASYRIPPLDNPCAPGSPIGASPRGIEADPTSELGDERFVVDFDSPEPVGHVMQEFRYDELARTIAPVSARVLPHTPIYPLPGCTDAFKTGGHAVYDSDGSLWTSTSRGLAPGGVHAYFRDPQTGKRGLESECSWLDPETGQPRPSGYPCTSDLDVGTAFHDVFGRLRWGFGWAGNTFVDYATHTVLVAMKSGELGMIRRHPTTSRGYAYSSPRNLVLGKDALPADRDEIVVMATKGILDAARRAVWMPIESFERFPECGFFDCVFPVGVTRNSWLYRIDLGAALDETVQIVGRVRAPSRFRQERRFTISFRATLNEPLHTDSGLRVYADQSGEPAIVVPWEVRACRTANEVCTYRALVPGSVSEGAEQLRWHGILLAAEGPSALHVTGRLQVR